MSDNYHCNRLVGVWSSADFSYNDFALIEWDNSLFPHYAEMSVLTSDHRFYLLLIIFSEIIIKTQNGYFNRLKCT